jgi:hypothetical protein
VRGFFVLSDCGHGLLLGALVEASADLLSCEFGEAQAALALAHALEVLVRETTGQPLADGGV